MLTVNCIISSALKEQCRLLRGLVEEVLQNQKKNTGKPNSTEKLPSSETSKHPIPAPQRSSTDVPTASTAKDNKPPNDTSTAESNLQCILEERRKVAATILEALNHNIPLDYMGSVSWVPPVSFDQHPKLSPLFQKSVEEYDKIWSNMGWKCPHSPRFWLRKASWWLLKVLLRATIRTNYKNYS